MTPRLPPNNVLVENQETTSVIITDAKNGSVTRRATKTEAVMLNPQTGERRFETTTIKERSKDGRVGNPDEQFRCRECGSGPWSSAAIAYCAYCQTVIGKQCCVKDHATPVCRSCRRKRWWKAFFMWFFHVGGTP